MIQSHLLNTLPLCWQHKFGFLNTRFYSICISTLGDSRFNIHPGSHSVFDGFVFGIFNVYPHLSEISVKETPIHKRRCFGGLFLSFYPEYSKKIEMSDLFSMTKFFVPSDEKPQESPIINTLLEKPVSRRDRKRGGVVGLAVFPRRNQFFCTSLFFIPHLGNYMWHITSFHHWSNGQWFKAVTNHSVVHHIQE